MKKGLLLLWCIFITTFSWSETTRVIVRAKAKDAKFIGTSIGGALIIIRDNLTGEILAKGKTTGSTGNTDRIMRQPLERFDQLADDQTAKFEALIDLEAPILVDIEAYSPLNNAQANIQASTQVWLIPGKDMTGDGIVLEIPGFMVNLITPQAHQAVTAQQEFEVKANVVMMCGCTVTDGGLWNANQFEVAALIRQQGKTEQSQSLSLTANNTFSGFITLPETGSYEIFIYAYHPETLNTGVDQTHILVR
ncbi:MAG: hypothetical protein ACNS62_14975 [Candidatus Cyclobacteriaceae bacterium M3_2C_046]